MKRLSEQKTQTVLDFMKAHDDGWFAYDLSKATGLGPGDIYLALARLEGSGQVTSRWAQPEGDGPRRRLYSVVAEGN